MSPNFDPTVSGDALPETHLVSLADVLANPLLPDDERDAYEHEYEVYVVSRDAGLDVREPYLRFPDSDSPDTAPEIVEKPDWLD